MKKVKIILFLSDIGYYQSVASGSESRRSQTVKLFELILFLNIIYKFIFLSFIAVYPSFYTFTCLPGNFLLPFFISVNFYLFVVRHYFLHYRLHVYL